MTAGEVHDLLQHGVGQSSVALQCQCDNLETVYLSTLPSGGVLVSDEGRSFAYLARGTDRNYLPLDELNMAAVAEACQQAGATLKCDDPESHPSIECETTPGTSIAEIVVQVAEAVDHVFAMAMWDR